MAAPLRWNGHPARRSPALLGLLVAVVTVSGIFAMRIAGPFVGFLGVVCLLGAVGRFLVPASYRVDDQGVQVERGGTVRHRAWSELKRWEVRGDWILVSPFARPHFLDGRRGMNLDLASAPRDLVSRLEHHLGEARRA